jgi:hypothetical protein
MNRAQLQAFFDELEEIEKQARIFETLGRGMKTKVVPALQRFGRGVKESWKKELGEVREGVREAGKLGRDIKRGITGPARTAPSRGATIAELARGRTGPIPPIPGR